MRKLTLPVAAAVGAVVLLSACDANNHQAGSETGTSDREEVATRISSEELGALHYDALVQLLSDVQNVEPGSGKTPLDGRNIAKESCRRFLKSQSSPLFNEADCGESMDAFRSFTDRNLKGATGYAGGMMNVLGTSSAYSQGQLTAIDDVLKTLDSANWTEDEYASQKVSIELDRILEDSRSVLTEDEFVAVHDVIAVARGSAAFWSEYTDDLIMAYADMYGVTLDIELGKDVVLACSLGKILGFSCAGVALSDVSGAAGGAAVGLIFGPSVLAGAGGGAVAGSVENGVSQILSIFN